MVLGINHKPGVVENKLVFNKLDLRITYKLWIMGLYRGGF